MWLRRFVRRNTSPIPIDKADLWKRRLSVTYMIVAWNAFGLVCYMVYSGRNDWAKFYGYKTEDETRMTSGERFARMLHMDKAKIIRFSGLKKIEEIDVNSTKETNIPFVEK